MLHSEKLPIYDQLESSLWPRSCFCTVFAKGPPPCLSCLVGDCCTKNSYFLEIEHRHEGASSCFYSVFAKGPPPCLSCLIAKGPPPCLSCLVADCCTLRLSIGMKERHQLFTNIEQRMYAPNIILYNIHIVYEKCYWLCIAIAYFIWITLIMLLSNVWSIIAYIVIWINM